MAAATTATAAPTRRRARPAALQALLIHAVLILLGLVVALPFLWMISTSLKESFDAFQIPPKWIPYDFVWQNYSAAIFDYFNFVNAFKNTMIITVGVLVGRLVTASLVAYAFARLRFFGRDVLFLVVLATLMVPYHVVIIPRYIMFREMGWIDTFYPLIVPAWGGGGAFFIFLLRQFIMTIPRELDDAARVDGAGWFRIYAEIVMPQVKPALAAVAIFSFLDTWNDFFEPLVFLRDPTLHTLAISLHYYSSAATGFTQPDMTVMMAGATLIMIPPLLLFFFTQRIFIQGVVVSGIKG